jgi:hypothetical protein
VTSIIDATAALIMQLTRPGILIIIAVLLVTAGAVALTLTWAGNSQQDASVGPSLTDFWEGKAGWVLDVADTGLPVGESDTIQSGNELWSYLHASTASAGVVDSCGDPVAFPGCVTRWVSTDGGMSFQLAEPQCILACDRCPCDGNDMTWQQQYPRVAQLPGGSYMMVFEHGAMAWTSLSPDGITWRRPMPVPYTGLWTLAEYQCVDFMRIGEHPWIGNADDCMAGAPPGIVSTGGKTYLLLGMGQNPGHIGCYAAWNGSHHYTPCASNPLLSGSQSYGPLDARGAEANPHFDFRYTTAADAVYQDGYFFIAYEGIRGPSAADAGRDDQFALGFARARVIDSPWEEYPLNPVLGDVADNWGIGHADLLIVNGQVVMYTATPALTRGRYILRLLAGE